MVRSQSLLELKQHLDDALSFLGGPVMSQELDSMVLMDGFQLMIFYDSMKPVTERRVYLYYFQPQILPRTQFHSLYVFFSNLMVWYFETSMVIRTIEQLWMDIAEDHGNCKVSACVLEAAGTELLQSRQERWEMEKSFTSYIKSYRKINSSHEIPLNPR